MTKEEATAYWKQRSEHIHNWLEENEDADFIGEYVEAIDMAIEALQDRPTPCEKCIHVKSCRKVIILKNRTYKLIKYCSQGAERKGGGSE